MINNINYKCQIASCDKEKFELSARMPAPQQLVIPLTLANSSLDHGKMIIFRSGKCRLMGLRKPITAPEELQLPLRVVNLQLQSATAVMQLGYQVHLLTLAKCLPLKYFMYEPELFPALRLTLFNPLCVNVFSSGKVTILGLRSDDFSTNQIRMRDIENFINAVYKQMVSH